MKDDLPFSINNKNTEQRLDSRQDSPIKHHPLSSLEHELPQQIQYQLQKVFENAGSRQQKYLEMIKDQQSKMTMQAQKYLESLRYIKKQFTQFLTIKNSQGQSKWNNIKGNQMFQRKKEVMRLNSNQFTLQTRAQCDIKSTNQSTRVQPQLNCFINCYYYTPIVTDYIRQHIPDELTLTIRTIYPSQQLQKDIKIIKQEDDYDNINYLINRVPFQISTNSNQSIVFQFIIPCTQEAINYYRKRQFQLELINKNGMFVYAQGRISLKSLLYYEKIQTQWQLKPISFYSTIDGEKVGEMSVKFGNELKIVEKNEHYKIQSTVPLQIGEIKTQIDYNDQQSRMIQRISKFKTKTNSLLLGIGNKTQSANAQRFFQNQNERIVIMHRHQKQLQSIQEYKNSHKEEMMDKIFNVAVERYFMTNCSIGIPKYVIFNYHNQEKEHRKLFLKTSVKIKKTEGKTPTAAQLVIQQLIAVSVLTPKQITKLLEEQLITLPSQSYYEYQMDEEEQSMWAVSGMVHPIVLRVICFPPNQNLIKQANLQGSYQLKLTLSDEYSQQVDHYQTKLKLMQPAIEQRITIHGYIDTVSELDIPFFSDNPIQKAVISSWPDLVYSWNESNSRLSLRIPHKGTGLKVCYVIVNDKEYLYQLGCYQIMVRSYPRLDKTISVKIGEIKKINLDFQLDEQTLTNIYQQIDNKLPNASKGSGQLRVRFASSRPDRCVVKCQGKAQIISKLNTIYQVEAKIQSFESVPQKILIHAIDLDSMQVIKRWLIELQKQDKQIYKHSFKLTCQHNKSFKYKFQLYNDTDKQKAYRLYSSNMSILNIPDFAIPLFPNQQSSTQLQFLVRHDLTGQQLLKPIKIILTVSDGLSFTNYLFELTVRMK